MNRWVNAGLAVCVLVAAGAIYEFNLWYQFRQTYPFSPGVGLDDERMPGGALCEVVATVSPAAHYRWNGRMWQDPSITWEQVSLRNPDSEHSLTPPHTGPIRIGDRICGVDELQNLVTVYLPTGAVIGMRTHG